jgi:hypothetical protein
MESGLGRKSTFARIVAYDNTAGRDGFILRYIWDIAEDYTAGKAIAGFEFSHD